MVLLREKIGGQTRLGKFCCEQKNLSYGENQIPRKMQLVGGGRRRSSKKELPKKGKEHRPLISIFQSHRRENQLKFLPKHHPTGRKPVVFGHQTREFQKHVDQYSNANDGSCGGVRPLALSGRVCDTDFWRDKRPTDYGEGRQAAAA